MADTLYRPKFPMELVISSDPMLTCPSVTVNVWFPFNKQTDVMKHPCSKSLQQHDEFSHAPPLLWHVAATSHHWLLPCCNSETITHWHTIAHNVQHFQNIKSTDSNYGDNWKWQSEHQDNNPLQLFPATCYWALWQPLNTSPRDPVGQWWA